MSNDYQLANTTPAPTDFWTQGGSAVLAPPSAVAPSPAQQPGRAKTSPMTRAHRLLRGRYPLAITLAATGAVLGGIAGYVLVAPKYVSTGMVQIDPKVVTTGFNDQKLDDMQSILADQTGFLTSANVAEAAMADAAYVKAYHLAYPGQPLPDDPAFVANETVEHVRGSTLLNVSYAEKSQRVAETAAAAVFAAYVQKYGENENFRPISLKLDFDRTTQDKIDADLAAKKAELDAVESKVGGLNEVAIREKHVEDNAASAENELVAYKQLYAEAQATAIHPKGGVNDDEMAYQEIKNRGDRTMGIDLDARDAAQQRMDDVQALGYLPSSAAYQQTARNLLAARARVDKYARTYVAVNPAVIATPLSGSGTGLTSLDMMKRHLDQLQANYDANRNEAARLAAAKDRMASITDEIGRLTEKRTHLSDTMDALRDSQALTKSVLVSPPGEATLQSDKRKAIAGAGFVFGGLLPLGLMMLYGMKDSRFRYSDETTETELSGVALLGILPNLPDRLSDPQQAGIAAHCVHQIRTMLQISRSNDEPQVLAVTSASSGDGKTSLTLALGLSYAACGARTLLIDCDLLAAGLTHRLNVSSPDGVLEAVANRALLEYVRTTDIADVAILPVGTTHAHHASTLSPVALRRLLSEAKKQFDIVIVDTGPILASIEASLICAAADRTILAVARNQQRPLVERSIGHLQAIGASLAGVVFNRAQAKDFEKSMSGLALRSRPAPGNPAAGANSASGASAAKAVAGSFKRAG